MWLRPDWLTRTLPVGGPEGAPQGSQGLCTVQTRIRWGRNRPRPPVWTAGSGAAAAPDPSPTASRRTHRRTISGSSGPSPSSLNLLPLSRFLRDRERERKRHNVIRWAVFHAAIKMKGYVKQQSRRRPFSGPFSPLSQVFLPERVPEPMSILLRHNTREHRQSDTSSGKELPTHMTLPRSSIQDPQSVFVSRAITGFPAQRFVTR